MTEEVTRLRTVLLQSVEDFVDHDCMSMAAALAYYTAFSMPPMLLIIVAQPL